MVKNKSKPFVNLLVLKLKHIDILNLVGNATF